MADHAKPTVTSTYINYTSELNGRIDDSLKMLDPATTTPTNVPTNAIRYNSASFKWQKWSGTAWSDISIDSTTIKNTPAGNISSTTVQAAINELDTEKAVDTAVVHLAGSETITGTKTFSNQTISSVATGTAPFSIASTTKVTNLNVDLLKGSDWASPAAIGSTTPAAVSSTNLSYSGTLTGGTGAINIGSGQITKDASGNMGFSGNVAITSTGYVKLSTGTSGQRPASALAGMIRFNTDLTSFEGYNGSGWTSVGGGATGGGTDKVFVENGQTVTTNYTITANCNASSAGDITINDGVIVTIPTGARWVIN